MVTPSVRKGAVPPLVRAEKTGKWITQIRAKGPSSQRTLASGEGRKGERASLKTHALLSISSTEKLREKGARRDEKEIKREKADGYGLLGSFCKERKG